MISEGPVPGITRKRRGKRWAYFMPDGTAVSDPDEVQRLAAIGMPPAYRDCWFNPDPAGHLQATGFDSRGRKQYRYHAEFRRDRDSSKYDRLYHFGLALPALRARVEQALASRAISRERTVASVVRMLDSAAIRIGNEQYRKSNGSFGVTTLRMRHVRIEGTRIRLRFTAKSGKVCEQSLSDRSLLRFVRQMGDLPGQHLFQYLDEDGQPCPVGSGDINAFIKDTMGQDFTAKDFRTWAGSAAAFGAVATSKAPPTVKQLATLAAARLDNTPAIARKAYVHPAVLALVRDEEALRTVRAVPLPRRTRWLTREERGLLDLLERAPPAAELIAALS